MKLSVLILIQNEEEMIEDCLKQLSFADEIIVLDQNSVDSTVKIAKKYATKILATNFSDFDKNRNLLAKEAKGEWFLYLDADERLTQDSVGEIKKAIGNGRYSAFYFPRKNIILGRWLKHGGWWPDYSPRLFKKKNLVTWKGKVHESPEIHGQFGYFENPIEHLSGRSLSQMFNKTIKWAKIEAELFYEANNPKVTIWRLFKSSTLEFFSRYIIKFGFLDGVVGLIEAIYQALHKAIIYTYLWEMQNETKEKFKQAKYL